MAWQPAGSMPTDLAAALRTLAAYPGGNSSMGEIQLASPQLALRDRSRSRHRRRSRSRPRSRSRDRDRRALAEVAALRARVVELEAQQLGITSKAAGPKPSSSAAFLPYVEGELPSSSDMSSQLVAAPPAPKAPASRKGAPVTSCPKAGAAGLPIGA
jgi:hypothetical protein